MFFAFNLQSEGHGLKNIGPRLSLSKHTEDRCRAISRLKYDPSIIRTAKSYFTTIVNNKQKQSETKLDGSPKHNGANFYIIATLLWMLAVASVPPVYTTSQLDEGILCVSTLGKLGYGEVILFLW